MTDFLIRKSLLNQYFLFLRLEEVLDTSEPVTGTMKWGLPRTDGATELRLWTVKQIYLYIILKVQHTILGDFVV